MSTRAGCDHCGGIGADFLYEEHRFCCECMSAFTSWLLDGGLVAAPDQFAYAVHGDALIGLGPDAVAWQRARDVGRREK